MDILKMQSINNKIEDAITDVITCLEEDRFYPSVREAGTAPTDRAAKRSEETIIALIKDLISSGVDQNDIGRDPSFEEIVSEINSVQDKNIADDIEDIKEIDCYSEDNGETKYRYVNTIYEHKKSKRYIRVIEQRGTGDWADLTSSVVASETVKKEIVKYEWQ